MGADLHVGLNVQLTPLVSIFAEYRYPYFESEVEIGSLKIESELATHHAAGGIGFHF